MILNNDITNIVEYQYGKIFFGGKDMKTEEIVKKLSLDEKAKLLTGAGDMATEGIEKYGIRSIRCSDGPHGVKSFGTNNVLFPSVCTLSCSWDKEIAREMGRALAGECIANDVNLLLAPGVNIKRHILGGRNFEYFSEDPVLAGELASGYVEGLQEKGVSACLKHYAVNNQEEDRQVISVEVDERTLREIYLKAFEIVVKKANPDSIMCSYNKVNGVWCAENEFLLKEVLKNEWGYDGMVVSDWGAVADSIRSVKAGLDLQMPEVSDLAEKLKKSIEKGEISEEDIDEAVKRMINFLNKRNPDKIDYDREKQHEMASKIASSGIVLLKNEDEVLPLTPEKYKKVAVVGEYAVSPLINGQGSTEVFVDEKYVNSPLEELRKRLPDVEFKYIETYKKGQFNDVVLWEEYGGKCMSEMRECDVIVFFGGSMVSEDTEKHDRRTTYINKNQSLFMMYAMMEGKKCIFVMQNGGALILDTWAQKTKAIVEMWLGGEAAGSAIADVLCGNVNPSGKLSETFPKVMRKDLEYPGNGKIVEYKERFDVGYRYYDKHPEEILYPFGHGLSYTQFEYSDLKVNEEDLTFEFTLKNTGKYDGAEVCQLYVGDCESTVVRPVKELKKFEKVFLKAREEKQVRFKLTEEDLSYYNVILHKWVAENGEYDIYIGSSSQDIKFVSRINYKGEEPYSLRNDVVRKTEGIL